MVELAIERKVALLGNELHVNILTSIIRKAGSQQVSLYPYYRTDSLTGIVSTYAKLVKFIFTNGRNGVLHIMYPSHKLSLKTALTAMKKGLRIVFHWVGSDILLAMKRNYFIEYSKLFQHASHITVAPWLGDELREYGITVEAIVPLLPVDQIDQLTELIRYLPSQFSIGYYLPEGKETFYNYKIIERISGLNSDFKLYIVGSRNTMSNPNVEYLGKLPRDLMPSMFYKKIMVLVRMPAHDGLSQMVMETLLSGRFVVYNKSLDLPCVYHVKDEDEAMSKLIDLYESYNKGKLKPNLVCREGLLERFNPKTLALKLINSWFA